MDPLDAYPGTKPAFGFRAPATVALLLTLARGRMVGVVIGVRGEALALEGEGARAILEGETGRVGTSRGL